eukprot:12851224-Prorocentrum_lima.AAC.1
MRSIADADTTRQHMEGHASFLDQLSVTMGSAFASTSNVTGNGDRLGQTSSSAIEPGHAD